MNECIIRTLLTVMACGVSPAILIPNLAYAGDRAAMAEITPEAVLLRQGDLRLPVSLRRPSFTIDGTEVVGKALPAGPIGKMESGKALELPFAPVVLGDSSRLEVKLYVAWSAEESVLRKWAAYRLDNAKGPKLVSQVVLEDLDMKAAGLRLLPEQPIDSDCVQSRPVFLEGFFAGIEYPVARCRAENQRLILSHRPGLRIQPGTWYQTRKAVYGVTAVGGEKDRFKRYIDAHRPPPKATYDNIDIDRDVYFRGDLFRLKLRGVGARGQDVVATITTMAEAKNRLRMNCTACETVCEHIGAAVSLILEEKTALGLAAAPDERRPIEMLSEQELLEQALRDRMERAKTEKFRLQSSDPQKPWADYTITSGLSGKSYRVALRGEKRGDSFCSCPDFRTNTLGTCKHIMHVLHRVKRRFPEAARKRPYRNGEAFVHVQYGEELALRLQLPDRPMPELAQAVGALAERPIDDVRKLVDCIKRLEQLGHGITIYPDAEELIERRLFELHMTERMAEIRENPADHPLRKALLKVELLPYQLEGIAFAAGSGRAILADDMGLGKTIQGVGAAEILAREAGIGRVLIVCPASLKSQWRNEIRRFSDRTVQLITGTAAERAKQYDNDGFFTVCNYEQVLRDILPIERARWDLIILDEGQRIKNWESKTARIMKGLRSKFALVLSGTPLENRLDELYSVVQFVDDRRLPPAFRFFHRHRVVDEKGKVLGYKNLDQLRENLRPILLRRTRDSVLQQLPPRTNEIVRIPPTDEQTAMHAAHMQTVSMIARKPFISEMDLLRLQKALLMCRMSADGTFLVDKQTPNYSSKLEYLGELFDGLFAEPGCKALLFSEWTTMLNLIEPLLKKRKIDFVRLDGSVPQKKRQEIVNRFQDDPQCRLFITTNAGSTGLNLQAANTVINVDLPWNPAVLEQRIGRAHRMGQKQPVQVYVLVTEETIEESLLGTLSAKHDLALAALDAESDVTQVDFHSGVEELRRRLEVLLGAKPEAPLDVTKREEVVEQVERIVDQRDRVAAAGGEMLGAVFHFLGELVSQDGSQPPAEPLVAEVSSRLAECVEEDASGRQRLTITLPDRNALNSLAKTLAQLMLAGGSKAV